jgi:E3 ubiquitin-protein ligase ZSWIM2
MVLEEDESCCVCYEVMHDNDNLSYCKFGCGRNLHTECMERWVKHKQSNHQEVSCPLCRTDWGSNALEELKNNTKQHKELQRLRRMEENK